jgi:hypothetical protein
MLRAATAAALVLTASLALLGAGCGAKPAARPEPVCTAEGKQVECWWILHGCLPELSPRDACMSICRDQEKGQLKVCEGKLPHRADTVMLSVRYFGCDNCLKLSDRPLGR